MFGSQPPTVLFLTKNSLSLISSKFKDKINLEFPSDLVANLEITDPHKFEQLVSDFLSQVDLKGERVLIVLAEDILFQKNFTGPKDVLKEQINEFVSEIPFDSQKLKKVELQVKDGILVVAANNEMYQAVAEVVGNLGGDVEAVIPVTVFSGPQNLNSLTKADLPLITGDTKLIETANFHPQPADTSINPWKIALPVLAIIWLVLIIILIIL